MSELSSHSQESAENARVVPVFAAGEDGRSDHVEMVGVDRNGNPDPDDFAGYDPSEEDILTIWKAQHRHAPETPEDQLSYDRLVNATQEWHDRLAGFGKSAIHGSWAEAGVHLPCDYSDPPVYRLGDGSKALTRAVIYRVFDGCVSLTEPLADLRRLASIDPTLTGHDMYPLTENRRYFNGTQGEIDD